MGKKIKATIFTLSISIISSIVTVLFNLIYNNYIIRIYGSTANGLISTLAQFVALFSIIEGGFTTAAIVAVYEPIVSKNYKKLNDVLYTTKRIYLKIGILITVGVLITGSIYIGFIKSPYSYMRTLAFMIITVLNTSLSLSFLSKYSVLLQGDNKEYIQILLALLSRILTWMISMGLIIQGADLLIVYSINVVNVVLNILLSKIYERKQYPYVTYNGQFEKKLISGTEDVLFQKIANTIFTSTDLVLISVFINLQSASVYNLYFQVFRSVFTLLASFVQAPFNSFGQLAKDKNNYNEFNELFEIYQHFVMVISSIVLTVTGILIIPFVRIYTAKVNDFEYVYPSLAVLFFMQIYAQIINRPFGTILNATGNFKMQNKQCAVAAVVNIIVSLAFIRRWGISSIIFGSFCGTMVIVIANIYEVYTYIIKNGALRSIKNVTVNFLIGVLCISIANKVNFIAYGYYQWIFEAIILTLVAIMFFFMTNLLLDYNRTIATYKKIVWIVIKRNKKR